MDFSNQKRKSEFPSPAARKMARPDDDSDSASYSKPNGRGGGGAGGKGKPSFAQRMMAKMGHQPGQGLGKGGTGIVNPVEVKVRPTRIGLGAVREMTEQAKEEARRQAEKRGEEYEDTEDEERKARKRRQKAAAGGPAGYGSVAPKKKKIQYRTAADIEQNAEGLHVPAVLKSIIDATGRETKMLTSTAGLMTGNETDSLKQDIEAEKLAKRARRDLEAFVESWNELTDRQKALEQEEQDTARQLGEQAVELEQLESLVAAVDALQRLNLNATDDDAENWEAVTEALEALSSRFSGDLQGDTLAQIAVGTIHSLFKRAMANWHPLEDPSGCSSYLLRLRGPLGIDPPKNQLADEAARRRRQTTPYESLIYTLWLPKMRSIITNEWNSQDASILIPLVETWTPVLPGFVSESVISNLVVPKLSTALQNWNPKKTSSLLPHIWLFPWLQYLSPRQLDPKSPNGLLSDVNRKFRVTLQTWDLSKGVLPGLINWVPVLGSTLQHTLVNHLLPRLARFLNREFTINPAEQDLIAFEATVAWTDTFSSPKAMGQLLIAEFFPKWLGTLHEWLTSDSPDFSEVNEWMGWWEEQIPETLRGLPQVKAEFGKALRMVSEARDMSLEDRKNMPVVDAEKIQLEKTEKPKVTSKKQESTDVLLPEISFRDIVEQWCEEEGLLLIPLKEAHASTGLPLFRITASATGKGGVRVYFKGDVLWALERKFAGENDDQKEVWKPMGLEDGLIKLAERR